MNYDQAIMDAPKLLRRLTEENRQLREKVASYQQHDRARDIVLQLEARGREVPGEDMTEKVANILDGGRDLNVMEAALDMVAPDGSVMAISDDPFTAAGGDAKARFEAFILGGEE